MGTSERLLRDLRDLVQLLNDHNVQPWGGLIQECLADLEADDDGALASLRALFEGGGAGSWLDLMIHPMNGHTVSTHEVDEVNLRLRSLQTNISAEISHRAARPSAGAP